MKALGIILNSVKDNLNQILDDINRYGRVDRVYSADFGDDFENFL